MQSESQNIEYKESWRDEYLKWICGFAKCSKISRVTALRILSSLDKYLELIGGKGTDYHYVMRRF